MKYIGLDAHSGSSYYVIKNRNGRIESQGTVATTEHHLLELIRSIRRPRKIIFEEGVVSQWLYLLLKNEVDELIVCKPPERKGAKTDKVDACQLADDLRQERYVQVFHSDHSFMELRDLVSAHADVTQQLTRTKIAIARCTDNRHSRHQTLRVSMGMNPLCKNCPRGRNA